MCRKGESIFQRKDGRYEGRYIKEYSNTGKAIYGYVYAKTYNECKKKRNQKLINLKKEKNPLSQNNRTKSIDFNCLIDCWLESKKNKIKESSYSRYYQLINAHLKNEIGKIKVNKLTSEIINNFLIKKLESGKLDNTGGLSKNSVYDISLIIKQVLKTNKIFLDIMPARVLQQHNFII